MQPWAALPKGAQPLAVTPAPCPPGLLATGPHPRHCAPDQMFAVGLAHQLPQGRTLTTRRSPADSPPATSRSTSRTGTGGWAPCTRATRRSCSPTLRDVCGGGGGAAGVSTAAASSINVRTKQGRLLLAGKFWASRMSWLLKHTSDLVSVSSAELWMA